MMLFIKIGGGGLQILRNTEINLIIDLSEVKKEKNKKTEIKNEITNL